MDIPVWLEPNNCQFPDTRLALQEPNGLLAVGGSLASDVLLSAYRQGIFPWYSDDQPLLWWSPDPRAVLFPEQLRISRSLRKTLKAGLFDITLDNAFDQVIRACAATRSSPGPTGSDETGTWITGAMIDAYNQLHQLGYAHSVEVWQKNQLVGGCYGLAIGRVFFGESMFHRRRDASKVGFVHLVQHLIEQGIRLIDCQQATQHLESLGATTIPRQHFIELLGSYCNDETGRQAWQLSGSYP